ncbi:MAG: hypothetical protein M5U25_02005 [Planctomycetota bacterium]|nr:hypothetical protein [Planctomycetota bacterium]
MAAQNTNPRESSVNPGTGRVFVDVDLHAVYIGDISYYDGADEPELPAKLTIRTAREARHRADFVEVKIGAHAFLVCRDSLQAAIDAAGK